jgi:hypothetical protein
MQAQSGHAVFGRRSQMSAASMISSRDSLLNAGLNARRRFRVYLPVFLLSI